MKRFNKIPCKIHAILKTKAEKFIGNIYTFIISIYNLKLKHKVSLENICTLVIKNAHGILYKN